MKRRLVLSRFRVSFGPRAVLFVAAGGSLPLACGAYQDEAAREISEESYTYFVWGDWAVDSCTPEAGAERAAQFFVDSPMDRRTPSNATSAWRETARSAGSRGRISGSSRPLRPSRIRGIA